MSNPEVVLQGLNVNQNARDTIDLNIKNESTNATVLNIVPYNNQNTNKQVDVSPY